MAILGQYAGGGEAVASEVVPTRRKGVGRGSESNGV